MPGPGKLNTSSRPEAPSTWNFAKFTMEAMARATASSAEQQLTDAEMTRLTAELQSNFFKKSTEAEGLLKKIADEIQAKTARLNNPDTKKDEKERISNELSSLTTQFQYEQTRFQSVQNQWSTLVEKAQSQMGQDSKNLEQLLMLAKASSDIMAYLASALRSTG